MHEFPPPVWQMQDWSFAGILSILVFGIALPLVAAKYSRPTSNWAIFWAILTSLAAWNFGFIQASGNRTYDPHRYRLFLPGCLFVISIGTLVRLWWQSKAGRGLIETVALNAFCLFILLAVISPAGVTTPLEAPRRTQCKNNLKQLGLAMHNYHDTYASFPLAKLGPSEVSWRIALLPFVEHAETAKQYDMTQPWDSPANEPLQKQKIIGYGCPSRPSQYDSEGRFLTSYVVPTDNGAIFGSKTGTSYKDITDGTSNTLLILEACGTEIVWTEPRDVDSVSQQVSVNGPGTQVRQSNSMISSWHTGGAQVALADGSVRFMSSSIDSVVLTSLLTKEGGEVPAEW